jgi:hypothetical protein
MAEAVRMWIDKFQREVLIDDQHPLAIAQRANPPAAAVPPVVEQPAVTADTPPASAQPASSTPDSAPTARLNR